MNSFEFNKIAASLLIALLVGMTGNLISEALIHPSLLDKKGYIINTQANEQATTLVEEDIIPPITPLLIKANADKGGKSFQKRCTQCHTINKGEAAKIGPNLWNIVLGPLCHMEGYAYSSALQTKKAEGEGQWNLETLNHFIRQPSKFVKGTKMSFPGLKDDGERADLIAYLIKMNDNPLTIPTP